MKKESEVVENLEDISKEAVENTEVEKNLEVHNEETIKTKEAVEKEITELEEEVSTEVEESSEDIASQIKKLKNNDASKLLVEKAKNIVGTADEKLGKCNLLLSDDIKLYDQAKKSLKEGGLEESVALLSQLKYEDDLEEVAEESSVVFESNNNSNQIRLKDVSSGKFTGFVFALLGGAGTLAGFAYFATEKLGTTLDLSKVPTAETLNPIMEFYGKLIDVSATIGGALIAVIALLVMWTIYALRVSSKGNKNLNFARKQLEDAEVYGVEKSSCKDEMDKVDAHIKDAIVTLGTYQALLNEQKGKLQRILHIEGEKDEYTEYHQKSISEMKNTQALINSVKSFMSTSMSEDGKLSGQSTLFLHSAKSKMQKTIDRLY